MTDGALARRILGRRGYAAITFGNVIICAGEPTDALWRHERRHVMQYERVGVAFIPLYLWFYARHGYATHPLERDAAGLSTLFQ